MRKMLSIFIALLLATCILSGCSEYQRSVLTEKADISGEVEPSVLPSAAAQPETTEVSQNSGEMFTRRDLSSEYDADTVVKISFAGSGIDASSDAVEISGSTVRITQEGIYLLYGTSDNAMLIVDADENAKIQLVLSGLDISCESSAALYIRQADKVVLSLAEGSHNNLSNGGVFSPIDENNIDAAVFSKQDLSINGSGTLTVASPAGHGIVSKDDLVLAGGRISVSAAAHAISANDSVRLTTAELSITAGKDGIHSENKDDDTRGFIYIQDGTLNIKAEGDGISAGNYVSITGGNFDILAGGGSVNAQKKSSDNWGHFMGGRGQPWQGNSSAVGEGGEAEDSTSMKGIKGGAGIYISGGEFQINSADDAFHSNTELMVDGGTFTIASGDDAIHAEETLTINGGNISISDCYEGLEALHVAVYGGEIELSSDDDGINAAGGVDNSGFIGGRDGGFGGRPGGHGGMMSGNSDGSVLISGGNIKIYACGDGIDANGTLEITGGHIIIEGPTQGDTATLDYDVSAHISGGTFVGTGAYGMAQTFQSSAQGHISISVGNQGAGTEIILLDKRGNEVLSYAPEHSFQIVILSSPEIISGELYTIKVGENSAEFNAV